MPCFIGDLSVRDNIIFALQVMKGFFKPFSKAQAQKFAEEYIKLLEIKTASADTPIKSLSGGNQQKVVLAKWMLTEPDVLILDEPTRGVDVGAKYEIYCVINELAKAGKAVIVISSEMPEIIGTCDRTYVINEGELAGELSGDQITQEAIMSCIMAHNRKE